jgi:hypothetical protein
MKTETFSDLKKDTPRFPVLARIMTPVGKFMAERSRNIARSATESLRLLWNRGFFEAWKKYTQIVEGLSADGYHFSTPELGMALKRAKYLTRRGKRGSYEYIQKHPFIEDEEE